MVISVARAASTAPVTLPVDADKAACLDRTCLINASRLCLVSPQTYLTTCLKQAIQLCPVSPPHSLLPEPLRQPCNLALPNVDHHLLWPQHSPEPYNLGLAGGARPLVHPSSHLPQTIFATRPISVHRPIQPSYGCLPIWNQHNLQNVASATRDAGRTNHNQLLIYPAIRELLAPRLRKRRRWTTTAKMHFI